MPNGELSLAQLRDVYELDLGRSQPHRIAQSCIDLFADASDDHQWIHVDPKRAAAGPFRSTIAHGYLTLGLVPAMLTDLLRITDQQRGTNYGIDRARFPGVVPVDADLVLSAQLGDVTVRPDGGVGYLITIDMRVVGVDRPSLIGGIRFLSY